MSTVLLALLVMLIATLSWYCLGHLERHLRKQQVLDLPNDRSMHNSAVPRGGGLVIVGILMLGLVLIGFVSGRYLMFSGIFVIIFCWAALSWKDDRDNLSPRKRLLFHLLFALLTLLGFGYVVDIRLSTELSLYVGVGGAILTLLGILWFTNLYNFMDGMDGLAASQTIIAGITMSFWFWQAGDRHLGFICLLIAAASYGFLLRNWHPAQIFMGDVGSITIGGLFSMLIIIGNNRYQIPVMSFVLLFSVFIADASLVLIKRLLKGEKVWLPHREHLYQRVGLAGVNHAKIVIFMVVLMLLSAMIASFSVLDHDRIMIGLIFVLGLLLLTVVLVQRLEKKIANSSAN